MALGSCSKEEEPSGPVVADFEVEKEFFEMGEPIHFINKSENAVAWHWEIGPWETSTEENPVFTPDMGDQYLGFGFWVTLKAIGKDGNSSEARQKVVASKRLYRTIIIQDMDESLQQLIPREDGKETQLLLLMGRKSEPLTWLNDYQTIPAVTLPEGTQWPFEFPVFNTWPVIAMDNTLWIMNLYAQVEGSEAEPVAIHSFEFIPTEQEAIHIINKIHRFTLSDDLLTMEVHYTYI